jgi:hypothetical protein
MTSHHQDIGRITLTVLFIGGLLATSLWIVQPFLPAILWATTLFCRPGPCCSGLSATREGDAASPCSS